MDMKTMEKKDKRDDKKCKRQSPVLPSHLPPPPSFTRTVTAKST